MRVVFALLILLSATFSPVARATPGSVFLEDLTWTEVRDALAPAQTTIIIPVGGTEQNGPHMALGKHNVRVRRSRADRRARSATRWSRPWSPTCPKATVAAAEPATCALPARSRCRATPSEASLEGAARSFRQHGFRDIVLIGDHGGYQAELKAVAARLNRDWAATSARAHFVADYYRAAQPSIVQALARAGLTDAQIGTHAGSADTSLMLAVDPRSCGPSSLLLPRRRRGSRRRTATRARRLRPSARSASI